MKSLLDNLVDYFIHPKLQEDIELFIKVKTTIRAYLLTSLFILVYIFMYEIIDEHVSLIKRICNYLALISCVLTLYFLKRNGELLKIMYFHIFAFLGILFTSTYYSGGIYSADIFWLLAVPLFNFMYNDKTLGFISLLVAALIFCFFYVSEVFQLKDFRTENIESGVNYEFFNIVTITTFISLITIFYINSAEKIKQELQALKEKEVRTIDTKFQYIIENAKEIISLHNKSVEVTYISPSVKTILEYEPEELIGMNVRMLFGIEATEFNKSFIHECVTKSGKKVWLEITMNRIYDELGTGDRFISLARDITSTVLENKRINELREEIANDFHDEIGNKLAAITLNANVLSLKMKDHELNTILNKIQETSKSLYQNSRDFIWSIDSKSDLLGEMYTHIRDFGEDFFQSLPINFIAESSPVTIFEKVKLPMYSGRHIILICTEAFTNAAKHANCNTIVFGFYYENDSLTIKIKDNGIGFNTNDLKNGKGMTSIKKRAKIINFNIKLQSDNFGTTLTLTKKLPV